jgi:WD40 repeat protein
MNIELSPDGKQLASASFEGYAKIFDTETGELKHIINVEDERMLALAFSPNGKLLATAG